MDSWVFRWIRELCGLLYINSLCFLVSRPRQKKRKGKREREKEQREKEREQWEKERLEACTYARLNGTSVEGCHLPISEVDILVVNGFIIVVFHFVVVTTLIGVPTPS